MTTVLALDIAFVTGFAYGPVTAQSLTALEAAATKTIKPFSGEERVVPKGSSIGEALDHYEKWLSELIEIVQPEILIFEAPIFTSKTAFDTARKLIGMAGITEMVAKRKGIRDRDVFEGNNQTVKSHFAGTGRADKGAMVAACQQRGWDIEAGNHNEADALALFDYATACLVK